MDKKKKDANSLNFFLDEFNVMEKKDRKGILAFMFCLQKEFFVTFFPTI